MNSTYKPQIYPISDALSKRWINEQQYELNKECQVIYYPSMSVFPFSYYENYIELNGYKIKELIGGKTGCLPIIIENNKTRNHY